MIGAAHSSLTLTRRWRQTLLEDRGMYYKAIALIVLNPSSHIRPQRI
jgi:hypothetical protein